MNIQEYKEWRTSWLKKPTGPKLNTPRGKCTVGMNFEIYDKVRFDLHLKDRELEDAEFNLMFHGIDQSPEMKAKLYGDDEPLYRAYKSLNIHSLVTNGKRRMSRKNIIYNRECCLCFWHLHGDTLTVVSRSWDIQRAGLSDLVIINRAAIELNCTKFRIITMCNHVYDNRETIARRT